MTKKKFKNELIPLKGKLYRLAVSLLSSRTEAEDVIQDVYVKMWEMREKLTEYNSLEALAMAMTKNRCIDQLRSYRSKNKSEDGLEGIPVQADLKTPMKLFETKESLRQVQDIMQDLPDRQRVVLHLREVEQYSYDEIEEITEFTRNNIRVILSRARQKVRQEYKEKQRYENGKN